MRLIVPIALFAVSLTACSEKVGTPVRTTLEDGQVLVGEVYTPNLTLQTGFGDVAIPLGDVGEVFPVEGGDLEGSGGQVSVWLRNGTELVGTWSDPELSMGIEVGGSVAGVELPVDDLLRFQLQGAPDWPEGDVYRVRTSFGDDFMVDPETTRLAIDSNLGTFEPFLSECSSAAPLGDPEGDWRIVLHTGTVLIGPIADEGITFGLPMGPEEVTVPLQHFTGLDVQVWGHSSSSWGLKGYAPATDAVMPAEEFLQQDTGSGAAFRQQPARKVNKRKGSLNEADGWFSNSGLQSERELQYRK